MKAPGGSQHQERVQILLREADQKNVATSAERVSSETFG